MSKFQTFLKVFEKNDEKVILTSTNIIMGQLNTKGYEYDNGVTIFWLCKNLQALSISDFLTPGMLKFYFKQKKVGKVFALN